jgi:hypothetical protein
MRLQVLICSVDRWVPRLHPSCLSLSRAPTDGARRGWARGANRLRVDGLGLNRNGSHGSRHLLAGPKIHPSANLKNALNCQDAKVFPQVHFHR